MLIFSDELQATTETPTEAVHIEYDHSTESEVSLESRISPTQCKTGASSIHEKPHTHYTVYLN